MELGMNNSLLAGDSQLIDHIVGEVKSQGIFDQFRKECLADVDTKPAYQNLRTRVEGSVNSFLNKQTWRTDLNKNQLRETLRKHIHDAPYLEVGVERIVDQVVNPKIYSVFMPQIEDVVYKFLGIERPKTQRNGACDLKDLLPKDLDPVSPESDRNSLKDISLESVDENMAEVVNGNEQKPSTSKLEDEIPDESYTPTKIESSITDIDKVDSVENGESQHHQIVTSSPAKTVLNSSFKSDETNKTEEEEEDSPVFEPIDVMNLNESNMSNDSHLSGISELTSHRSQSPDFMTEFSRDNFDCSNQDSQLSKVSSNSRLSIVTDFGSSNHASTPVPESKEDSKYAKDNFKAVREFDSNKDDKFNFDVVKSKDSSKTSNSSKENSRDASDYKESKSKEESNFKSKYSRDRHDSRSSKDKDRESKKHHSSKSSKSARSKSKDKNEPQENKENPSKCKESNTKESERKEDTKEVKDLKDLYKEKIRELREKKELTEKEKLGKDSKDFTKVYKDSKDKKESSSSREKDDYKKSHKSSRSTSYHNSKSCRSSESKDSRDRSRSSSSKRDDRRHSNGKNESKSSTKSKRDSRSDTKSERRSSDRSVKDKKRREDKKSKATDDHSSLRKNSNDRRSTDRDGSNGSSSKYSHKSSYGANNSSAKLGPSNSLAKDNKDHSSSGDHCDTVHDSLQMMFGSGEFSKGSSGYNNPDNPPRRVDPGSTEICLPLKKRPLHNEDTACDIEIKKPKIDDKKIKKKDIFKIENVASVPDEERVQIIEIPDEDYDEPYPVEEPILSLEETKKIILDTEPMQPMQSKLSEMEQSIRQSLNEMMSDHRLTESDDALTTTKLTPVMDSDTLLETLTDDSSIDSESLIADSSRNDNNSRNEKENIDKTEEKIEEDVETIEKSIKDEEKKHLEQIMGISSNDFPNDINIEEDIKIAQNLNEIMKEDREIKKEDFIKNTENIIENAKVDEGKTVDDIKENLGKENIEIKETNTYMELLNKVEIEKTNEGTKEHVEKSKEKQEEKTNADIKTNVEKLEEDTKEFSNVTESKQHISYLSEKIEVKTQRIDSEKFFEEVNEDLKNDSQKEQIELEQSSETTDSKFEQDEESTDDYNDEFNEEDKLVIDEEFDEKQNNGNNDSKIEMKEDVMDNENVDESTCCEKTSENVAQLEKNEETKEEIGKSTETEKIDENEVELEKEIIEEAKVPDEALLRDDDSKKQSENSDNNERAENLMENVAQEQMKNRLIDELSKFNKDDSDAVKVVDDEETVKKPIKDDITRCSLESEVTEKSSEPKELESISDKVEKKNDEKAEHTVISNKTDSKTKINDEDVNVIETKKSSDEDDCDEDFDKTNKLETSSIEKSEEELNLVLDEDSNSTNDVSSKSVDVEACPEPKESKSASAIEKREEPSTSSTSQPNRSNSPVEEDCLYLECDNQKYLRFKRYLEKLEADPSRSLEDMVESFGGVVVPAVPMAPPPPLKRKLTLSPIVETMNNNDDDVAVAASLEKEDASEDAALLVVKKRKPGRAKKSSSATVTRPEQLQQQPQPQQLPPQLQQAALVNGENFVLPLSPESDVSATSDKNPANTAKEERSRRKQQRYSSDDLYKPRPLFSSSSRRNRRFNPV